MHQFEDELKRKYPEDHPETRLDIPTRDLHHTSRTDCSPDKNSDRTAKDQGNVKAATRQVPKYAEEGREDDDKTHNTGRIFRRIAAEEYQEGHDKDPAANSEQP